MSSLPALPFASLGPMRTVRHRSPPWVVQDSPLASSSSGNAASAHDLPPTHFLSRPRIFLSEEGEAPLPSARPDLTTLASADFDVDVRSGFLPPSPPCVRLPPGPWEVWEQAWEASEGLRAGQGEGRNAKTREWRTAIRERMPVVAVQPLATAVSLLRRAHAVLAYLAHIYVQSEEPGVKGEMVVPKAIAIPFCSVSQLLDVPPVLSYADTVLYNWRFKDPSLGFRPDNIEVPLTFTRTESERHFFKTSFLIETLGPTCLGLMRASLDEAFLGDALSVMRIAHNLNQLSAHVGELTKVVEAVRNGCEPRIFYWEIRPWFNGGKWAWEGVKPLVGDSEESGDGWRATDFGGPSAGQSTLIHSLDVFLGVDHRPRPDSSTDSINISDLTKEETFMMRMAAYMPHHHRHFLAHLINSLPHSAHPIRRLAGASPPGAPLRVAYDTAVRSLEDLRKAHSRIALLYIVSQSRVEPPDGSAFYGQWREKIEDDARRAEERKTAAAMTAAMAGAIAKDEEREVHKGTGGSDLAVFLRRCRKRTQEALLGELRF